MNEAEINKIEAWGRAFIARCQRRSYYTAPLYLFMKKKTERKSKNYIRKRKNKRKGSKEMQARYTSAPSSSRKIRRCVPYSVF